MPTLSLCLWILTSSWHQIQIMMNLIVTNSTRPDISFAVNKLAAYTANLGLKHHGAIKWLLKYRVGMKTLRITYKKSQDETENNNLFHGYTDAVFVNADEHKSMTGCIFLAVGGAITKKSKK